MHYIYDSGYVNLFENDKYYQSFLSTLSRNTLSTFIKDEKVIMNLYPSEARFLINLLNKNVNGIEISKDWMDELKRKKEEYKKSKEGE